MVNETTELLNSDDAPDYLQNILPAATALIQTSATTQSQMRRTLIIIEKAMGSDNEHAENRHLILAELESGTSDFEKETYAYMKAYSANTAAMMI